MSATRRVASWPCQHCGNEIIHELGPFPSLCADCRRLKRSDRRARYVALAHSYVTVAIFNGDLPRLDGSIPCFDCGEPACEYDHRDYKKPMEVEPVCRACNQARGPGKHRDPSETGKKPLSIRKRFDRREAA